MTSTVATQQQPSATPTPKPRKEFLGPLKSLVRSISGNNLASKNKKHEKATTMPAPQRPPPEKLVKGRRRASSFWMKKPTPPYYGDTQDLRYSSADQLASTLRESFRAVGFQDITPYDNPALGNISRQSSQSRLNVHPLATPNMPTIIFSSTPPRSPSTPFAPSPLSPAPPTFASSSSSTSPSRPSSRPPSRPGTPTTMELRFDVPTFLPLPPQHSRNGSSSSSDFASLRGTPRGSTVSLPQHRASFGISGASPAQSPVRGSASLPFLNAAHRTASASTLDSSNMPSKSSYDGSSIRATGGKQEPPPPGFNSAVLLNSPPKAAPSPLRETPITASPTGIVLPASRKSESEQTEVPMSPLARPQFPNLNNEERPVSLAGSELSAPGLNNILTGFDEVDAQLQEMLTQRGRELSDAVGSPDTPAAPINISVAV